jgi:hypothetical protein
MVFGNCYIIPINPVMTEFARQGQPEPIIVFLAK